MIRVTLKHAIRTEIARDRAERYAKLIDAFIAAGLLFTWLVVWHDSSPTDKIDSAMILLLAVGFGIAALVQGIYTSNWPARTIGVLFTSIGACLLYSGGFWVRTLAHKPADLCDIKKIQAGTQNVLTCNTNAPNVPEWYIDLFRTFLLIGVVLLIYGLLRWVGEDFRDRQLYLRLSASVRRLWHRFGLFTERT